MRNIHLIILKNLILLSIPIHICITEYQDYKWEFKSGNTVASEASGNQFPNYWSTNWGHESQPVLEEEVRFSICIKL